MEPKPHISSGGPLGGAPARSGGGGGGGGGSSGGSMRAVSGTAVSYGRAALGQAAVGGDDHQGSLGGPGASGSRRPHHITGVGKAAIRRQSGQVSSGGDALKAIKLMPPLPRRGSTRRPSANAGSEADIFTGSGAGGGNTLAAPLLKQQPTGKPSNPFESAISVPFGRLNGSSGPAGADSGGGEESSPMPHILLDFPP